MRESVEATIRRHQMFSPAETVVVGVSGGPDSCALLDFLVRWGLPMGLNLVVAHLDHALRPASRRDALFVKKLAAGYGLAFYTARLRRGVLKKKGSLEEILRVRRYAFLEDVCRRAGAKKIALGHTLDDQAETVLMRLLRGSGLFGLSAILPRRLLSSGIEVVRPLIETSKKDVLAHLKKRHLSFRVDQTNDDAVFLRNKIRGHLLPLLEKRYNPGIRQVLAHLACTAGADYRYLEKEAASFLDQKCACQAGCFFLPQKPLFDLDIALCRLVLRLALEKLKKNLKKITLKHLLEIEDLALRRPQGAQVHLPDGIIVAKTENAIKIFKR